VIRTASTKGATWIEVDNHDDLARAREIACHY
jgi:choline kinase